jgi:hypothetical protein
MALIGKRFRIPCFFEIRPKPEPEKGMGPVDGKPEVLYESIRGFQQLDMASVDRQFSGPMKMGRGRTREILSIPSLDPDE